LPPTRLSIVQATLSLLPQAEVLLEVCQKIIAPNMALLTADEELFDENPFEYVRKDIEGSDADTRRRVSVELVRGGGHVSIEEGSGWALLGRYRGVGARPAASLVFLPPVTSGGKACRGRAPLLLSTC
jgi:hypothetical protein